MTNFVTLSQARVGGSRYPLATLHYPLQFGGRPQAASLVQGGHPPQRPPPKTRPAARMPPSQQVRPRPNASRQVPNRTNDRERAIEGPTRNANAIKNVLHPS